MNNNSVVELVKMLKGIGAGEIDLAFSDSGVTKCHVMMAPEAAPPVEVTTELDDFVKANGERPDEDEDAIREWDKRYMAHLYYRSS